MKLYYLPASLPSLHLIFKEPPPFTCESLWGKVQEESPEVRNLIQTVLLRIDLENLERVREGKKAPYPATIPEKELAQVLRDEKLRKRYLPGELSDVWEKRPDIWPIYFDYAVQISEKYRSSLARWLRWDRGLRYFFAQAHGLKMDTENKNLIARSDEQDFQRIFDTYHKAADPLAAEQKLDEVRWKKIGELCTPYSFEVDEVVVFALQISILERWWIISQNQEDIFQKVANG